MTIRFVYKQAVEPALFVTIIKSIVYDLHTAIEDRWVERPG